MGIKHGKIWKKIGKNRETYGRIWHKYIYIWTNIWQYQWNIIIWKMNMRDEYWICIVFSILEIFPPAIIMASQEPWHLQNAFV